MEAVTLLISFFCGALIVGFRPIIGLCIYCACFLLYPQALTVMIGTIDFNTGRILVLVLAMKTLASKGYLSAFKWSSLDTWMILTFIMSTFALQRNVPIDVVLVREGGAFVDGVLAYFLIRIIVRSKADLEYCIKTFVLVGLPLAFLGVLDAKSNYNPYDMLSSYYGWGLTGVVGGYDEKRSGFYRASGSFGNAIIFGLYYAALIPMLLGFLYQGKWKKSIIIGLCGVLMIGLLTSVSSAPLSSIIVSLGMICAFRLRRYWPVLLVMFFVMMAFTEVYSNRHFYHVLGGFAFSGESAYYRIGLMEEAFGGGMAGHWLFGYGYVGIGPGNYNDFFNWDHMDLVNIYIRKLAQVGLFGLIPYLVLNFLYYRRLYQAGKLAQNSADLWLVWCYASALVGWNVAMLTVSALSQIEIVLAMYIGISQNMPSIVAQGAVAPTRAAISLPALRRSLYRLRWRSHHV